MIKGGGPNNRMGSKMKIPANDFLLEADLMIGGGNTNCNAKFGFKAAEGYDGDRLQLRFSRGTWCTWRIMEEPYIILFIFRP